MAKQTITLSDNYHPRLYDKLSSEQRFPRGVVGIYDKLRNGDLKLVERKNLIVYQGREWLLQRAFGPELQGASDLQDRYIKWFGLGTGGGEPGNPLQAGVTRAWDVDLTTPLRINPLGVLPDYAPRDIGGGLVDGYYKKFSSVIRKDDPANAYTVDSVQYFPQLIAEIRTEISSEDGNGIDGSGYADINEAGLFIDNPTVFSQSSSSGSLQSLDVYQIIKVSAFTNDIKYVFASGTDLTSIVPGDRLNVSGATNAGNDVTSALILDVTYESGGCLASVTVENLTGVDEGPDSPATASIDITGNVSDIFMFSRVTFSTIRKTIDREIIFLWKIYF